MKLNNTCRFAGYMVFYFLVEVELDRWSSSLPNGTCTVKPFENLQVCSIQERSPERVLEKNEGISILWTGVGFCNCTLVTDVYI